MDEREARERAKQSLARAHRVLDGRNQRYRDLLAARREWLSDLDTSRECTADQRCLRPATAHGRCDKHQEDGT